MKPKFENTVVEIGEGFARQMIGMVVGIGLAVPLISGITSSLYLRQVTVYGSEYEPGVFGLVALFCMGCTQSLLILAPRYLPAYAKFAPLKPFVLQCLVWFTFALGAWFGTGVGTAPN